MKTMIAASMFVAGIPSIAYAIDVYPGCAVPTLKAVHHTFYVDPVRGSDDGNGSASKPWKNLTAVIGMSNKLLAAKAWSNKTGSYADVNPTGPIKAGDVVMLMSGNYGTLKILNSFNTDFVWVMAAPGQTPIIRQMNVVSSAKWVFQGIKFQGETPTPVTDIQKKAVDGQVTVGAGDYTGITNNIAFDSDTFSTTDNTSGWSDRDWILKPYFTSFQTRATCVSLTNSKIYNVFNGVMLGFDHNLMQGNTIQYFSNDGVDLTHSFITVKNNVFSNAINSALDPQHADGIQGWSDALSTGGYATNYSVLIDSNTITKVGDPSKTYLQGISFFDGKWDNLVVQNNVVTTNTLNGISVFGAKNSKILNNTLVSSGANQTMLRVQWAKDGTHSSNVLIRNNIGATFAIADTGLTTDHNVVTGRLIAMVNGVATNVIKSQSPQQNLLVPSPTALFVKLDPKSGNYDLRLKPGSPAVASGSVSDAPTVDINGKRRSTPMDMGAYTH